MDRMCIREQLARYNNQFKKLNPVLYSYGHSAHQERVAEVVTNLHSDVSADGVRFGCRGSEIF